MNAFMVFAEHARQKLSHQSDATKDLISSWKSLPEEKRQYYINEADYLYKIYQKEYQEGELLMKSKCIFNWIEAVYEK